LPTTAGEEGGREEGEEGKGPAAACTALARLITHIGLDAAQLKLAHFFNMAQFQEVLSKTIKSAHAGCCSLPTKAMLLLATKPDVILIGRLAIFSNKPLLAGMRTLNIN
jgi:hypothetical protein